MTTSTVVPRKDRAHAIAPPFATPRTVKALVTFPGANSSGWPRLTGAGSTKFAELTGTETSAPLSFS